jgi:transcriptional regulator with XRE-family HTH domain
MTPLTLRLAELRRGKDWTIDELAERSGVSRATIGRLERKQTTRVDFEVLEKLANALGVNAAVLIDHKT